MSFASISFLFFFLPIVLSLYVAVPKRYCNAYLVLASLVFYYWGGGSFVLILIVSAAVNYTLALAIPYCKKRFSLAVARTLLVVGVAANLAPLLYYKYGFFIMKNLHLSAALRPDQVAHIKLLLPLGISFFTFHALSYLVDVYRGDTEPQRRPVNLLLYLFFFPQLIAGPIIRYKNIQGQIRERLVTLSNFSDGVMRFSVGLGKKVLIANTLAPVADAAFNTHGDGLGSVAALIGIVAYALQLYFDFSGYTDMAIGMAKMFGFTFPENFNYPYAARSIQDFWRRWHISLSAWFRDYLYIPLGGSREGDTRTYANLLIVFLLVGLWHGAGWTFIVWGAWHGMWLIVERVGSKTSIKVPRTMQHAYTLVVVLVGWIFFRAESLPDALSYLRALFGLHAGTVSLPLDTVALLALCSALLASVPWRTLTTHFQKHSKPAEFLKVLAITILILLSATLLADGSYNPFIYYHF